MFRKSLIARGGMAIDLGTANVLVYMQDQGIVVREPCVVAVQNIKGEREIVAVGEEAKRMIGRTPGNIRAVRPLHDGVIADVEVTEVMLKYFVRKAIGPRSMFRVKPNVVICVPCGVTQVERRAVEEAILQAGAFDALIVEEPLAAAIGADMPVDEPTGVMIVDIGGGTTEVAIISLGGIVASQSIRLGGNRLDQAIMSYIRKTYNVSIGEYTAEELKIGLGSVYPMQNESRATIRGIDVEKHLPTTLEISSEDIYRALREPVRGIIDAIKQTLEDAPPELSSDIMVRGITLTGGGAQLLGLDALIHSETGIPAHVCKDPLDAVVLGAGKIVDDPRTMRLIDAAKR
ncbi:MAG: rod shape-determining protein [Clostridia bacterium]|nr:rod shape-determining protein [Clostridia bacterium]MBR3196320.1 rod shape-determining protein [Clostridia bacterium]